MVTVANGRFELPNNLSYSSQHVYLDKEKKVIGLDQLGYAFMDNPTELKILVEQKAEIKIFDPIAIISNNNKEITLYSPISGNIDSINNQALKHMKNDTYGQGFIIKFLEIKDIDPSLISGVHQIEDWANNEVRSILKGVYTFKIIEIGDSATGKTAIKVRLTDNYFKKDLKTTLGVDFGTKELNLEFLGDETAFFGESHKFTAKMSIWDAAGQEHYERQRGMYYRGAKGALLVYDVNNPVSFNNLDFWINELDENIGRKVPVMLVGNKIDLERKVSRSDAENFAKKHNFLFAECSAKTGDGVLETFNKLAIDLYKSEENL